MPAAGARAVRLPGGNKQVEELLLWRDPRKSGAVFAGITALYVLLEWSHVSLLKIVSHTLLAGVVAAFLYNNFASFRNRPGLPLPAVIQRGVSEMDIKVFAEKAVVPVNKVLAFLKRLISGEEVLLSVQAAAALYAFGWLGSYFTSLALVYTLVVLAFALPKAYELKKDEVDSVVNTVQQQTSSYYRQYAEPYVAKIPRASTSTASGSVAPSRANGGDVADSYTHVAKEETKKAS